MCQYVYYYVFVYVCLYTYTFCNMVCLHECIYTYMRADRPDMFLHVGVQNKLRAYGIILFCLFNS